MVKLQEWFNKNNPKDKVIIHLKSEISKENLEGSELIIESFSKLEHLKLSDLSQLSTLIIKDCENLEGLNISLDKKIDIRLEGEFPKLKNFKVSNTQQQPIIIQQELNKPKSFCWDCIFKGCLISWGLFVTFVLAKTVKKQRESEKINQQLRKQLIKN